MAGLIGTPAADSVAGTEDGAESNDGSLETAAEALQGIPGLLDDDDDDEEQEGSNAQESSDTDDDADETEDDESEDTEDADEDDEDDEQETEDEDEESDEDDDEEAELITVKVDGKKKRVTLDELKKGYSRTEVFTQRTQEASATRKQAEAALADIAKEREVLVKALEEVAGIKKAIAGDEPDWARLREGDPVEYTYQRELYRERQEEIARLAGVSQELQKRNAEEARKGQAERVKAEHAKLMEAVPAWEDSSVMEKDLSEIRQNAKDALGFTDEELDTIADSRAVLALRDAARYRKLMRRKAELKKGTSASSSSKSGTDQPRDKKTGKFKTAKPGKSRSRAGKGRDRDVAMDKLKKTGSVADAAQALLHIPGLLDD